MPKPKIKVNLAKPAPFGGQTAYLSQSGDQTGAPTIADATTTTERYFLTRIEVSSPNGGAGTVVAFGDAVIDFETVVRDPGQAHRIRPEFDSGDHGHLNDAGYRAMADSIDLKLFANP